MELGVSDFILPLMSNNVSKLICNSLAVNKPEVQEKPSYVDGLPSWLKAGDRKLLQASSSVQPNLVVAQDGSGSFKTIKDALDAAAKQRKGSERFVIRVKSGVYSENLVIGNSMKNIMLIGDSIRNTIITGSRSVGGGSTTFNSATVAVTGEGFIAREITFRNTAEARKITKRWHYDRLPTCLVPLLPPGSITASTSSSIATCSGHFRTCFGHANGHDQGSYSTA
ncbi:hypothetical protein Scep_015203 [Stephania cephalantha]|uniref:Pectinesterase catalytic domain-containing protein n=1 Tax=Stephania cephalantha TaxID=152367 RepID=A0AAP0J2G2_9MAGN